MEEDLNKVIYYFDKLIYKINTRLSRNPESWKNIKNELLEYKEDMRNENIEIRGITETKTLFIREDQLITDLIELIEKNAIGQYSENLLE